VRPALLLVAASLLAATPALAQPKVQVFAGPDGGAYEDWLSQLISELPDDLASFELIRTRGSQDSLLRMKSAAGSVGLVQRDVLGFAVAGAQASGAQLGLKVLATALEEQVWVAGPTGSAGFWDVDIFDVGEATTGSAFTLPLIAQSWTGLAPVQIRSRGPGEPEGLEWAGELDTSLRRGLFRVNPGHPWSEEELDEAGLSIIPLGAGRIQRALLADPAYHPGRASGSDTVAVQAMLATGAGLDTEVATAILDVLHARLPGRPAITRPDRSAAVASTFYDLGLPEHPALIRFKLGPRPYSSLLLALTALALLLFLHVVLWTRGVYRRMGAARQWRPGKSRRIAGLVALLLGLLTWTIAACLAIKYLELGPMLAGDDNASEMWRLSMGGLLRWMFVLVTVGYEADIFPATSAGQMLAASVQTGAYAGIVLVASNLFLGAVEAMMKRYLNRGDDMELDDHLVICNWTPEAEVILRELRRGERTQGSPSRPVVIVSPDDLEGLVDLYPNVFSIQGRPSTRLPLQRAEAGKATAAIVLRSSSDALGSDAATATTCMKIRSLEEHRETPEGEGPAPPVQILAEVLDAAAGRDLGRFGVEGVGRDGPFELDLLAETVVSPRVSRFYEELLRFDDSVELYSIPVPRAARGGRVPFGSLLQGVYAGSLAVDAENPALVLGVLPTGTHGPLLLNPRDDDEILPPLDDAARLLVVAWSQPELPDDLDLTIHDADASHTMRLPALQGLDDHDEADSALGLRDHVVIFNWTENTPTVLERIRAAGVESAVVAVTDRQVVFRNSRAFEGVSVIPMAPLAPGALDRVDLRSATTLLLLADRRLNSPDSATLLLVMRLRQMLESIPPHRRPTISAEVVDPREVSNIRAAGADEVVCGTEMLYRVFAQAVFNPAIVSCFRDLLRHSGDSPEAYVIPVPKDLVDEEAHFGRVVARAAASIRRGGENPMVPVGFLPHGQKVLLNPRGPERTRKLTADDKLLVLQYSR